MAVAFTDIHCHLLPGLDDGARDWDESLAMSQLAAADGTVRIIATPHQMGNYGHNRGAAIRERVAELRERLAEAGIAVEVLPGADVRIEPGMVEQIVAGDVLTLGDRGRHVLLELPHELYLPLTPVLDDLGRRKMVGILSHPERNQGILRQRTLLYQLVEAGCLMQITAGSLTGAFGPESQALAEWMLGEGLVHFVASDGHGPRSRRPRLRPAFDRVAALVDEGTAIELCQRNPAAVAAGESVAAGRRVVAGRSWWRRRKAS